MGLILRCIVFGLVALLFCWLPVADAAVDCAIGRGSLRECARHNWGAWLSALKLCVRSELT